MEKKRTIVVNALVIAALLLLTLGVMLAAKLTERTIVPNAGPLEFEFEPAVTTAEPSSREGWMMDI